MKTTNQFLVLVLMILSVSFTVGQEKTNCQVIGGDVDASYVGKCKDGLANGKGVLTYLNSKGKYMFVGNFKKGKMHGEGQLFVFEKDEKKLLKEGFWKKSVYAGEKKDKEKAYRVIMKKGIERYNVRKVEDVETGSEVFFDFRQNGGRNNVGDLNIYTNTGNELLRGFLRGFEDISFPFKCRVNYYTWNKLKISTHHAYFEIEIYEPGIWEVTLHN